MEAILETRDVTKEYGAAPATVKAVDNVSLGVTPGEFIAVVGPSGSGKTTLLALLAGLLAPSRGSVLIGGADVARLSEGQRARFRRENIGFSFQSNNLVPYLTALENVELALRLKGNFDRPGRARAKELLARLGLADKFGALPAQLSGGQQQRVAIARALVHEPLVVLADEPTAALDTERGMQVVQAFRDLVKEQGRAGVMVTHDLRMVRFTDAVARMVDGRLAEVVRDHAAVENFSGLHGRPNALAAPLASPLRLLPKDEAAA